MWRWTGNGVTDGTAVSSGNVNTAGNGDTATYSSAGTGGMTYAGDGFDFYASAGGGNLRRLDVPAFTAARQVAVQAFYTPQQIPTSAQEAVIVGRSASADTGSVRHLTDGTVRLCTTSGGTVQTGPVLTNGHRYQIDLLVLLNQGALTTTNGRLVILVTDLSDSSWNTTGDWYYDSGYAINAGTADMTSVRFGKTATSAIASGTPARIEQPGCDTVATDLSAVTGRSSVAPYFMVSPYGGASGNALAVVATASATAIPPQVEGESVITGGGPASATALALPPVVSGTQSATVVAPAATSSALALPPTLVTSATAAAVVATSSGVAIPPTTSTTRNPTVVAVTATATGTGVAPAVFAGGSAVVLAAVATGTAAAPVPVVSSTRNPTVVAVTATATSTALAPTVSASGVATVVAPAATASAAVRVPTVTGIRNATVQAVAAQANAQALAVLVAGVVNGTVVAVRATATGMARVPTITGGSASDGVPVDGAYFTLTARRGTFTPTATSATFTPTGA